ncbi:MAG: ATP-dependent DNA helicase [Clostridia bacterium]|nr:ATP-dependent DNA helicase [Clostridia bacterium]
MKYDKQRGAVLIDAVQMCRCAGVNAALPPHILPETLPDTGSDAEKTAIKSSRNDPADKDPSAAQILRLPRSLRRREIAGALGCGTAGDSFRASVRLEMPMTCGGVNVILTSVCDGVCLRGRKVCAAAFREVTPAGLSKSPSVNGDVLLCINAWLLGASRGLEKVSAMLIEYVPGDPDGGYRITEKEFDVCDLYGRVSLLLGQCRRRIKTEREHADVLDDCASLKFPYPSLRAGQKELISSVYSAVKNGRRLFAQAPTGIGKTISVLYGAVRAMSGGDFRRIFYLTAKASTRREAYAAAGQIYSVGARLRTVVLTAKEQICPMAKAARAAGIKEGFVCDPETCPLMKDYANRRGEALDDLLGGYHGYPTSAVVTAAAKAGVCPYELSLDLSEHCDIIICDYNYAFDPGVKLRRYFSPEAGDTGGSVFLVDEAHNLTERARDIYSAVITSADLDAAAAVAQNSDKVSGCMEILRGALEETRQFCRDEMQKDEEGREYGFYYSQNPIPTIDGAVEGLCRELEIYRFTHRNDPQTEAPASVLLRLCRKWQSAAAAYDDRYRTYVEVASDEICVRLFCLDPSGRLGEALEAAHSAVFFSATLTPSDYFADVLGGGKVEEGSGNCRSVSLPSPFPRENLCLCAVTSVSTRFDDREKSARKIAAVIAAAASAKSGNYIAYFPSYNYMETVLGIFRKKYPKVSITVQSRGMSREERDNFLDFFKEDEGKLRIGFCVLGGSFSEGVDLPGKRLIGTVVVGVGLPGLCAERNMIRDYYENRIERGYDYAYTYPGMNSVLQAAGRVIRRDDDRGVVVLVDDRYATEQYRELMPPHWEGLRLVDDLAELPVILGEFWG